MARIWTVGGGLLDTHVTWRDVEKSLEKHFEKPIIFGENKTIRDVTGGTENAYLSRVGLINPDWGLNDGRLPSNFVIKIFTILNKLSQQQKLGKEEEIEQEMEAKEEEYFGYYHNEVTICQLMQRYLTNEDKFAVPKIYCINPLSSENRGRGFILMEFVDNDGGPNVANSHIKEMIHGIIDIQLIGRRFSEQECKELYANQTATVWEFSDRLGEDPIAVLRSVSDDELFLEKLKRVEPYIKQIKNEQFQTFLDQATEHLGIDRVFVHGDFHGGNVFWKKEEDGYRLNAVIDYQFSHFGSPAWDLVYFLLNLDDLPDEKLRNWRQFTKMFYELHSEQATPHFSYEQFVSAFLHIWPMWCLLRAFERSGEMSEENKSAEELKTDFIRVNSLLDLFLEFHLENCRRYEEHK